MGKNNTFAKNKTKQQRKTIHLLSSDVVGTHDCVVTPPNHGTDLKQTTDQLVSEPHGENPVVGYVAMIHIGHFAVNQAEWD